MKDVKQVCAWGDTFLAVVKNDGELVILESNGLPEVPLDVVVHRIKEAEAD